MHYWYMHVSYEFRAPFLGCTASNINMSVVTTVDKIIFVFLYVFEVLIPAVPALIFSVATFVSLYKTDKILQSQRNSVTSKRFSVASFVNLYKTDKTMMNQRYSNSLKRFSGTIISTPLAPLSSPTIAEVQEEVPRLSSWSTKRQATVTILILITTYFALNIWFWLLTIGDAVWIFSEGKIDYTNIWNNDWNSYFMTYYVIYIHTVVLNSVANGVIYFARLKDLQRYVKNLVCKGSKTTVSNKLSSVFP